LSLLRFQLQREDVDDRDHDNGEDEGLEEDMKRHELPVSRDGLAVHKRANADACS